MGFFNDLYAMAKEFRPSEAIGSSSNRHVSIKGTGNVVVVNGKVVSGNSGKKGTYLVDEIIAVEHPFTSISATTKCSDVVLSPSKNGEAAVKVIGRADTTDVDELVSVNVSGSTLIIDADCHGNSGCLTIYVDVPAVEYDCIKMTSMSGDISCAVRLACSSAKLETASGDILSKLDAYLLSAVAKSGDISLSVNVEDDMVVSANTMSGDIDLTASGSFNPNIEAHTMSGDVINRLNARTGSHVLSANLSTMSGDISIR